MRGDGRTMAGLKDMLSQVSVHQEEMTNIWRAAIMGMHQAAATGVDDARGRLMDFALWFSDVRQDDATRDMYGDLAIIYGTPNGNGASVATMRTAAKVAKVIQENAPGIEHYLMLAKDALLMMLECGEFESRKSAATGLAYLPDPEVRARLVSIAQGGRNEELREAAGESIATMRTTIELNLVMSDRELLLDVEYPDPADPRRECLEQMLDAARIVLEANGRDQGIDYATAVRKLVVFGCRPEDITDYFYTKRERRMLDRMMMHAENALLRALVRAKDERLKEEAALGLENIGSDRVEDILEKIADRPGDSNTARIALEALEVIRGKKVQMFDVKPLPPPRPRRHSDPNKVLKVKL